MTLQYALVEKFGWESTYQIALWPLAVTDEILLLYKLDTEIRSTGGSRQRSEGRKLLRRIRYRWLDQMKASSEKTKANETGWDI